MSGTQLVNSFSLLRWLGICAVLAGFGEIEPQPGFAAEDAAANNRKPGGVTTGPSFSDPAPPTVNTLPATKPPRPQPYARVDFHAQPKPLPKGAATHDWTALLGPTHNSVSTETKLLKKWPPGGPKLVWELQQGTGYSSPVIQDVRLVFCHRVGREVLVECLHPQTGDRYWQFKYPTQYQDRFGYSNGPRSSPVIQKGRVYIYSVEGKLFCLKLETGQVIWKRNLSKEFKVSQEFFGTATTPLVHGNLLIINVGAPNGPCVIALEAQTGKMVWGAGRQWGQSYSTPVPATIHGRRRVFVFAGGESRPPTGGLISIDPADGSVDFDFFWRSKSFESVNASCPVVVGNQVFISASYKTGGALLSVNSDFSAQTAWTSSKIGTHWNTAVHKDGYLYAFDGRNEPDASLVCVELKTGEVIWREAPQWEETVTINGQTQELLMSTLRGSLLRVDGHFLCLGELGHLLWLDLSPKGYREIERAWLFASRESWALPVLSRGLLYVSQNRRDPISQTPPRLLCYDLRAE